MKYKIFDQQLQSLNKTCCSNFFRCFYEKFPWKFSDHQSGQSAEHLRLAASGAEKSPCILGTLGSKMYPSKIHELLEEGNLLIYLFELYFMLPNIQNIHVKI